MLKPNTTIHLAALLSLKSIIIQQGFIARGLAHGDKKHRLTVKMVESQTDYTDRSF